MSEKKEAFEEFDGQVFAEDKKKLGLRIINTVVKSKLSMDADNTDGADGAALTACAMLYEFGLIEGKSQSDFAEAMSRYSRSIKLTAMSMRPMVEAMLKETDDD